MVPTFFHQSNSNDSHEQHRRGGGRQHCASTGPITDRVRRLHAGGVIIQLTGANVSVFGSILRIRCTSYNLTH